MVEAQPYVTESLPRLTLVTMLAASICLAVSFMGNDGSLRALASPRRTKIALIGLALPSVTVLALETRLDASAWSGAGPLRPALEFSSSEPERLGFLLRPLNAHSSNCLIAAGAHVWGGRFDDCPWATAALSLSLSLTGLASYAWWGSRRQGAWKCDNRAMEWMLASLAVRLAAAAAPRLDAPLVIAGCAVAIARWPADSPAILEPLLVLAGLAAAALHRRRPASKLAGCGLACAALGLVSKVADLQAGFTLGTVGFHALEAFAFALLAAWARGRS